MQWKKLWAARSGFPDSCKASLSFFWSKAEIAVMA